MLGCDRSDFEDQKDFFEYCRLCGREDAIEDFQTGSKHYCEFKDFDATDEYIDAYEEKMRELKGE